MEENEKRTPEEEGRELKFSFRLSKEEKADLEHVAKKLAMGNKTNFIIQAVQRFKDHPEQWNLLGESVIQNLVTKEELKQTKEEILQKHEETIENLLKTQEIISQMQFLLAHQQENSHKADFQDNIKFKVRKRLMGIGSAHIEGYNLAEGGLIISMDADLYL